ncbi:MAG: type II toxin-antitoxin system RelE/ParE family toxin [Ruminococcus sp.]|nr:type II toxin-antitoxin system RelE/ParE family toxin [Ruminococcus sp.]
MNVKYSRKTLGFLAEQDKTTVDTIRYAIQRLTLLPPEGDIKKMHGSESLRLRIGGYRVIFRYTDENGAEALMIDGIDSRGDMGVFI